MWHLESHDVYLFLVGHVNIDHLIKVSGFCTVWLRFPPLTAGKHSEERCVMSTEDKYAPYLTLGTSPGAQMVKHLPTMQEIRVQSLDREDLLEKKMAPHSSILAWKIPWMVEPGRLQSMGVSKSQTRLNNFTFTYPTLFPRLSICLGYFIKTFPKTHIYIPWWRGKLEWFCWDYIFVCDTPIQPYLVWTTI